MKTLRTLSLLFLLLPAALYAQNPTITSVSPASGPASGGTQVAITGTNLGLPPGFACILPCPARVSFGTSEVAVIEETNTRLVAVTPAHEAATVAVTVKTGDGRSVTVPAAFTYIGGAEAQYEALLLPVYLDGTVPGNKGSLWKTDFWIRNAGSANVALAPWVCPEGTVCLPVFPLTRPLLPGETLKNLPAMFRPPTNNPARLLYVERSGLPFVHTALRVYDASREGLNAGTDLPIVRNSELRTRGFQLLNVPADARFRQHLRVYDLANTQSRFRVSIYENTTGTSTAQPIHQTELAASTNDSGEFRVAPAYAEIASIQDLLGTSNAQSLRVEIEPLTAGSRFWAFISVTNNDTQFVTLVTPN